jgi:hypothetical protein
MAIATWLKLFDEAQMARQIASRLCIGRAIARSDNQADFFDTSVQRLLGNNLQNRFWHAIAINQALQWQRTLVAPSRRNNRTCDSHNWLLCQTPQRGVSTVIATKRPSGVA